MRSFLVVVVALAAPFLPVRDARACGGIVQADTGSVSQTGQQALLVFDGTKTSVVLTLDVPGAGNDFAVLVPVAAEPTIDANPVSTAALAALETATRPVILAQSGGGGGGCGCATGGTRGVDGAFSGGEPVEIGPVTAQWISGGSGDQVADFLQTKGFVLPTGTSTIVNAYIDRGNSFLAFFKSDPASDAERIGVRFTLDGDQRAYAMRLLRMGGADEITLTIHVAAAGGVAPDMPWLTTRVGELDLTLLQNNNYAEAVKKNVAENGFEAFVIETIFPVGEILTKVESNEGAATKDALAAILPENLVVTRLFTITDPSQLGDDVTFTTEAPPGVTNEYFLGTDPYGGRFDPRLLDLALIALFAALLVGRALRRLTPATDLRGSA